jgi:hypothetical protein
VIDVQELDETQLDPLDVADLEIPRVRLTLGEPTPYFEVKLGDQPYRYERSFPIKGHGATLPRYAREQMAAGRKILLLERPQRFLVYLDA